MKILKKVRERNIYSSFIIILLILNPFYSCEKKSKIVILYSQNKIFSKKTYFNQSNGIDSIDYNHKDKIYARYLVKENQIFGYEGPDIKSFKNNKEVPIVYLKELKNSYKVVVKFQITSYVLWKFMVAKGSKMMNFESNILLNSRSFEIPKESMHLNFIISNNEKEYFYNIQKNIKNCKI
jgi:hypothetical protein